MTAEDDRRDKIWSRLYRQLVDFFLNIMAPRTHAAEAISGSSMTTMAGDDTLCIFSISIY
jgi:hypothetical protein